MSIWDPKQTLDAIGGLGKKDNKRSARVAEAVRIEIAGLLISKVADPRLQSASISRVEVTEDLSLARIFFTVFGGDKEKAAAQKGFERASGFMRSHLAKELNLRFTPALQFRYDDKADKVSELEEIFQEIANEKNASRDDS